MHLSRFAMVRLKAATAVLAGPVLSVLTCVALALPSHSFVLVATDTNASIAYHILQLASAQAHATHYNTSLVCSGTVPPINEWFGCLSLPSSSESFSPFATKEFVLLTPLNHNIAILETVFKAKGESTKDLHPRIPLLLASARFMAARSHLSRVVSDGLSSTFAVLPPQCSATHACVTIHLTQAAAPAGSRSRLDHVLPHKYYRDALDALRPLVYRPLHVLVFCHNAAWCLAEVNILFPVTFLSIFSDDSELEMLSRLSKCKLHVVSSTATWLSAYTDLRPDTHVVVPLVSESPGLGLDFGNDVYFPSEWVRIRVDSVGECTV